jgi:hypothetical protein
MTSHGAFLMDDGDESSKRPIRQKLLNGGMFAAGLLAIVCICYGAFAFGLLNPPPSLDQKTGCRLDAKTDHTTIVELDATDPLTPLHIQRVQERLKAVSGSMPDYGKLIVVALNPDDPWNPSLLFEHCAPRSPERTSALQGGSEFLRNQWREFFEKPLLESVGDIVKSTEHAKKSPILLSISGLTQRPDFDAQIRNRRFVYIGDLVEHDLKSGYSQMRGGDMLASFKASPLAKTLSADLQNATVIVDYLKRPEYAAVQNATQRQFWRWWFEASGAAEVTFYGVKDDSVAVHKIISDAESAQQKARR